MKLFHGLALATALSLTTAASAFAQTTPDATTPPPAAETGAADTAGDDGFDWGWIGLLGLLGLAGLTRRKDTRHVGTTTGTTGVR